MIFTTTQSRKSMMRELGYFSQTRTVCYEIETKNVYEDMRKKEDLYDFSNFPKDHLNYNTNNNKVIGKFKDECGGGGS